jgi:hypothetical protein
MSERILAKSVTPCHTEPALQVDVGVQIVRYRELRPSEVGLHPDVYEPIQSAEALGSGDIGEGPMLAPRVPRMSWASRTSPEGFYDGEGVSGVINKHLLPRPMLLPEQGARVLFQAR